MAASGQKLNLDIISAQNSHYFFPRPGMDTLLDPRNKSVEEFFIFLKIQDGCRRSKISARLLSPYHQLLRPMPVFYTLYSKCISNSFTRYLSVEPFLPSILSSHRRAHYIIELICQRAAGGLLQVGREKTFLLGILIRFIGFRQNLAWT